MKSSPYLEGFSKAAEERGLDPYSLVKFASSVKEAKSLAVPNVINSLYEGYNNLSPTAQKSINGALLSGLVSFPFTDGDTSDKLKKALLYSILGGVGTYALDRYGLLEKGLNYARKNI